jgi:hypothetical protein
MELTVLLSAAGVVGPCPQCREEIQAPPVPAAVARRRSVVPAPTVLPAHASSKLPSADEDIRVKKSASGEVRVERRVRKLRSSSSQDHKEDGTFEAEEGREAIALIKGALRFWQLW